MTLNLSTPAFIYDTSKILERLRLFSSLSNCKKLYALKALEIESVLNLIATKIDGFAVSSLFEAKLAKQVLSAERTIHYTAPALREDEFSEIEKTVQYINFNSINQFYKFNNQESFSGHMGLRVNPRVSLIDDPRYDPCSKKSRLGIPMNEVIDFFDNDSTADLISGIHFHNNCDSDDFRDLEKTLNAIIKNFSSRLKKLKWINLGGGYIFHESHNLELLQFLIDNLHNNFDLEVFLEPGAAIVRDACLLVASVLDIIKVNGKQIAILDTTVNHLPEIFEYQFQPDLLEAEPRGKYKYTLAGNTCLAGDIFGDFCFKQALDIGSQITFINIGAYSHVKSHMFNGVNLPSIYQRDQNQTLLLIREYTYDDFLAKNGSLKNSLLKN